jgi:hypothetical protein
MVLYRPNFERVGLRLGITFEPNCAASKKSLRLLDAASYSKIAIGKELPAPGRHGLHRVSHSTVRMRGAIGGVSVFLYFWIIFKFVLF